MRYFKSDNTAEQRPIVVVWEDLHWADRATEEFIAMVGESLASHRSLMIVTHRPGYAPPLGDRLFHTRLSVGALSATDSAAMARELLSTAELPEDLRTLLVRWTEGNLAEILRSPGMEALRREGDRLVVARDLDASSCRPPSR